MLDSLLIKVVGLKVCNFFQRTLLLAAFEQTKKHFFLLVRRSIENNLHRYAEAMRLFCKKNVFLKISLYS